MSRMLGAGAGQLQGPGGWTRRGRASMRAPAELFTAAACLLPHFLDAACPAAPPGYTLHPQHCVGGPGHSCSGELKTSSGCSSLEDCVAAATTACTGKCHAFAIEVGGPTCESSPHMHWHTFSGGNVSLVANSQWVAYAKPGGAPAPAPAPPPAPNKAVEEVKCTTRQLTTRVAHDRIGATFGARGDELVRDALRLHECPGELPPLEPREQQQQPGATPDDSAIHFTVSPTGSDTGDGSAAHPFRSPTKARDAIRALRKQHDSPASVTLLSGHYPLGQLGMLELTTEDSYTRWVSGAAPGQPAPFLSGAVELSGLRWEPHAGKVLKASLPRSATGPLNFATLLDGEGEHRRLIRARTPNGNPEETSGLCFMKGVLPSEGCDGYIPHAGGAGETFVGKTKRSVKFNTTRGGKVAGDDIFRSYDVIFQAPPANLPVASDGAEGWLTPDGFLVAVCNQGGGGGDLYNRSGGVKWSSAAGDALFKDAGKWAHPTEAVVHMMHNGWGNIQYKLASILPEERTLLFERGGWQHGRGGGLGSFYVENQLELLDAPVRQSNIR